MTRSIISGLWHSDYDHSLLFVGEIIHLKRPKPKIFCVDSLVTLLVVDFLNVA